ncbi:MAG: hypothetical protein J6W69_05320, partial [Bacteroidales bacterium]|nr:hypothetical protein [Bacteroidales bacterium]
NGFNGDMKNYELQITFPPRHYGFGQWRSLARGGVFQSPLRGVLAVGQEKSAAKIKLFGRFSKFHPKKTGVYSLNSIS